MGRLPSKPISFKTNSVERVSGHGFNLGCPICTAALMLKDTRDGDQAYWCHSCNRGWRAGHLPPEARRAKAKALLETSLEAAKTSLEAAKPLEVVVQAPPSRPKVSKPAAPLEVAVQAPPSRPKIPKPAHEVAVQAPRPKIPKPALTLEVVTQAAPRPKVSEPAPEPVKKSRPRAAQPPEPQSNLFAD